MSVLTAVESAAKGTFTGGNYIGTLRNGVALAPFHTSRAGIPTSVQNELEDQGRDHRRHDLGRPQPLPGS